MYDNVNEIVIIKEVDIGTNDNVPEEDITNNDIEVCPIDDHQTMGINTDLNIIEA